MNHNSQINENEKNIQHNIQFVMFNPLESIINIKIIICYEKMFEIAY